ncbi:hypothetical protein BD779DRAFT_1529695 [Infundibulicybe gibba]|nr:hypothetical protein BD779DRAFT_1529695 [Infundibulicybe gibba]
MESSGVQRMLGVDVHNWTKPDPFSHAALVPIFQETRDCIHHRLAAAVRSVLGRK